ncbi:hypothetical protein CHS0354_028595 [Potamilus streckersoni]|uniref:Amine oxidase n=1 Tax=Potamilus streckersoni TaxID=2493646 RepID=A0AAE0SNT3_9BIVA|nr:hypothetical protein CHS0354_028595 [Potamilus streckersoni]
MAQQSSKIQFYLEDRMLYKDDNNSSGTRNKETILKCCIVFVGFQTLTLFLILVSICVVRNSIITGADASPCPTISIGKDFASTEIQREMEVFAELTPDEIEMVVKYVQSLDYLKIVSPSQGMTNNNFIHSMELKLAEKTKLLDYLKNGGTPPKREATLFLFLGGNSPPTVEEYVVGPLPNITYARRLNVPTRKTVIPYNFRPFSTAEFKSIFIILSTKVKFEVGWILEESYQAKLPPYCGDQCLRFSITPITSALIPNGTRKAWFWFLYDVEFSTLHPLDFQLLVDMTNVDARKWSIEQVWYSNQMFKSLADFKTKYESGTINKTRLSFPSSEEGQFSSLSFREPLVPEKPLKAPRQFDPDGPRFDIISNQIQYLEWKFNFRVTATAGLQLFNIRFRNEMLVYELSMQEVAVLYSGNNPASRVMNYADSAGLFGTRCRGLLPGVDCPSGAKYTDTYLYTSNENGSRIFEKAVCFFEHNSNIPLRRHRAYGRSGAFYGGLVATALIVRTIISVVNYDYVIDFMFYANGAIETKVSMTGYLGTAFFFPDEEPYATHVYRDIAGVMHDHFFAFKADIDVSGTSNRFESLDIKNRVEIDPWGGSKTHFQNYFSRNLRTTEKEAVYRFNFSTPKYLMFTQNRDISSTGLPRSIRIHSKDWAKQLIPEGYGFENAVPWTRYQIALTKYKYEEDRCSSIFTMWDAADPVVNLQKYIDDNDDIVDEDLVAWITLGTHHIPQTENIPNANTVGSQMSFFIIPFNYFEEDPSMNSRDAVRITPRDKKHPLAGAIVEEYGAADPITCQPQNNFPKSLLERNSTFLFS